MLAIRLQRTGRKGHAQFRMIVQEARRTPTSGSVVALLGQYNPHTKTVVVDKDKAQFYLSHGAQPSVRVARLLQKEGVNLPKWVQLASNKERAIRNPDKLRANRPPVETPLQADVPEERAAADPEQANAPESTGSEAAEVVEADNAPEAAEEPEKSAA